MNSTNLETKDTSVTLGVALPRRTAQVIQKAASDTGEKPDSLLRGAIEKGLEDGVGSTMPEKNLHFELTTGQSARMEAIMNRTGMTLEQVRLELIGLFDDAITKLEFQMDKDILERNWDFDEDVELPNETMNALAERSEKLGISINILIDRFIKDQVEAAEKSNVV